MSLNKDIISELNRDRVNSIASLEKNLLNNWLEFGTSEGKPSGETSGGNLHGEWGEPAIEPPGKPLVFEQPLLWPDNPVMDLGR